MKRTAPTIVAPTKIGIGVVTAALCAAMVAGCSSSDAAEAASPSSKPAAATTTTVDMRTPTVAEWQDMQDNMAKYAGWTFKVYGRSDGRTDQNGGGLLLQADILPSTPLEMKSLKWGAPIWVRGNSPEVMAIRDNDAFTALLTITGVSTNVNNPISGYPEATMSRIVPIGRVR